MTLFLFLKNKIGNTVNKDVLESRTQILYRDRKWGGGKKREKIEKMFSKPLSFFFVNLKTSLNNRSKIFSQLFCLVSRKVSLFQDSYCTLTTR